MRINSDTVSLKAPTEISGQRAGRMMPASAPLCLLGIYLGLYMIRPWEVMFPALQVIRFERVYALAMLAFILLSGSLSAQLWPRQLSVVIFGITLIVSSILGNAPALSWDMLYHFAPIVLSAFLISAVARRTYDLLFLVGCYAGFMGIYLGKALWEFHVNNAHSFSMGVVRLGGIESTYAHPNAVAASTVIVAPYLRFLWSHRGYFTNGWSPLAVRFFSYGVLGQAFLSVWAVILTNSRTGFVSMLAYVALLSLRASGRNVMGRTLLTAVIVLASWYMLPEGHKNRFRTIWDPSFGPENAQQSAESRADGLRIGIEIFKQHPVFGIGPGTFAAYRAKHIDGIYLEPHNLPGQILAEMGLVGSFAFSFVIVEILSACRTTSRILRTVETSESLVLIGIARASLHSLMILAIVSLTGHTLYRYNWLWTSSFAVLAAEFALRHRRSQNQSTVNTAPSRQ